MNSVRTVTAAALAVVMLLGARAANANPIEDIPAQSLSKLLIAGSGDIFVHLTSEDPGCGPCVASNAEVARRAADVDFPGKVMRVSWRPWAAIPADVARLPIKDGVRAVPMIVHFRDGQEVETIMGSTPFALQRFSAALRALAGGSTASATTPAAPPTPAAPRVPTAAAPPPPQERAAAGRWALEPSSVRGFWGQVRTLRLVTPGSPGPRASSAAWSSSAPDIASVDAAGNVRLIKRGRATITATVGQNSASATVDVQGFEQLGSTDATYTCAIADGRQSIYCWGSAAATIPTDRPAITQWPMPVPIRRGAIPSGATIATVVSSVFASCALTSDGDVYCWGSRRNVTLGDGLPPSSSGPVVAEAPLKLARGEIPVGVRIVALALAPSYGCVAGDDGEIYCWGRSWAILPRAPLQAAPAFDAPVRTRRGEIPTGAQISSLAVSINGGCAVAAGQTYCWKSGGSAKPARVASGELGSGKIIDIQSDDFTCGLSDAAQVYCMGASQGGRFGNGTAGFLQTTDWRRVTPNGAPYKVFSLGGIAGNSCAVGGDARAYCWGLSHLGSAGDGRREDHAVLAPQATQRGEIPSDARLLDISCGKYHCAALDDGGRLYAWGSNEGSAIGRPSPAVSQTSVPVLVSAPP